MNARLISYSKPSRRFRLENGLDENSENLQDLVAYCARVSNPSNQNNTETAERLLTYLRKEGHWSPFEMVSACLEIETTRDIARQILRHKSFSFQEFSQRYADPTSELDMHLSSEPRLQDTKNRQNSIPTDDVDLKMEWMKKQAEVQIAARKAVEWAAENNIAKEVRRAVLPEGLTTSRLYMNGTLRSWIHYVELRTGHGTQWEHMQVAKKCAEALEPVFPTIMEFVH